MNRKVGLLLPKSVLYPTINFDLMAGLKYGLVNAGITDAEIKTENIGLAADNKQIYSSCEKLIFEGCTIIAGYMNPSSAEKLEPLFANANALLIALDSGYHYPTSIKKLPHVFYVSLQGALCCRILAATAMEEGIKSFAFTGSFYDAGYRSPHAYASSVEDGGGNITYNLITPLKRSDFSLTPLADHLAANVADGLLASFCGDMLQDFCLAAAAENVFKKHPVYGSPFMGEEQWLSQSVYPGVDIKTCVPWASSLANEANLKFTEALGANKQRANVFSVLGWECALLIAVALTARETDDTIIALEGMNYESPRGKVTMDAATHFTYAPAYEAWIKENKETGKCTLVPIKESSHTVDQRRKLEHNIANFTGAATSWYNAYACLES